MVCTLEQLDMVARAPCCTSWAAAEHALLWTTPLQQGAVVRAAGVEGAQHGPGAPLL